MANIHKNDLSAILLENIIPRSVEPHIYSVLPTKYSGNEYDTQFGFIYDRVACNPIYNRLIWGYPVSIFHQMANKALQSSPEGNVLDLGCGSLAFTAKTYRHYTDRPVVLVDQSLKMLQIGKSRLIKQNGKVPDNLIFLQADALNLPFQEKVFATIVCENLLHCLDDTSILLQRLKKIGSKKGKMYFTTLVKNNRLADKYLAALAGTGKVVSRTVAEHKGIFEQNGISAKYETTGNLLSIYCD